MSPIQASEGASVSADYYADFHLIQGRRSTAMSRLSPSRSVRRIGLPRNPLPEQPPAKVPDHCTCVGLSHGIKQGAEAALKRCVCGPSLQAASRGSRESAAGPLPRVLGPRWAGCNISQLATHPGKAVTPVTQRSKNAARLAFLDLRTTSRHDVVQSSCFHRDLLRRLCHRCCGR